jgi:hypothetical protein
MQAPGPVLNCRGPTSPRGRGLLGLTLRYPYEVRDEQPYFEDIPEMKTPKDMLDLATHIVQTKSGHFNPAQFEDRYENALIGLLKKKEAGEKIEPPKERPTQQVVNLMDALRASINAEKKKAPAPSTQARRPAKKRASQNAKMNMVAIGRVVLTRREHIIALEASGIALPAHSRKRRSLTMGIPRAVARVSLFEGRPSSSSGQPSSPTIRTCVRFVTDGLGDPPRCRTTSNASALLMHASRPVKATDDLR